MNIQIIFVFLTSLLTTFLVMPFVIKFAIKIGAVDKPNERKVHQRIMPRIGGLGIFIGVLAGYIAGGLYSQHITGISIGAIIIIAVGILDDLYELSPKIKFLGQLAAAAVVVCTGLKIDIISIPFIGDFELSFWSYIITIFWIISIINAINLIDGLDGLSAGISSISIATIGTMAFIADKSLIFTISIILLGSTLGFLYYNFHPAKIFMGDTGSLFLGYSIAVLSLLGLYKSVTLFSFIVPIIILGVPVFDTSFAIIRRIVNKRPISAPDKSHLHHRLLAQGFRIVKQC